MRTETADRPCTCHTPRVGAHGLIYTTFGLGVLCEYCEAAMAAYEYEDWWESLSITEKIAERWGYARNRFERHTPPLDRRPEPPF